MAPAHHQCDEHFGLNDSDCGRSIRGGSKPDSGYESRAGAVETLNVLTFAVDPTYTLGLPVLVDYAFDGTQANAGICGGVSNCQSGGLGLTLKNSGPAVSQTGEFVAFASVSSNLASIQPNTNAESQIYVRDTCLGQSCTPTTFVVSSASNGGPSNGPSSEPSMDTVAANAAYTSLATNLVNYVAADGVHKQVYWQPICATGATSTTSTVPVCSTSTTSTSTTGSSTSTTSTTNADQAVLVSAGR